MRPSCPDIGGWHRPARVRRNGDGTEMRHVEPAVAEEQAILVAKLLINAGVVMIRIVKQGPGHNGVVNWVAAQIGPSVVGLDEIQRSRINTVRWNYVA